MLIIKKKKTVYSSYNNNKIEFFTPIQWMLKEYVKNYIRLDTNYSVIYYINDFISNEFLCFIDKYIEHFLQLFNQKLYNPLYIYIVNNDIFAYLFKDNSVDVFFDSLKGNIYINNQDKYVAHEIVHALMYQWDWHSNIFCMESLAESQKELMDFSWYYQIDCLNFNDIYFNENTLDKVKYARGGLFFRYLIDTKDITDVIKIYRYSNNNICLFIKYMEEILDDRINVIMKDFISWVKIRNWEKENWYFESN